MKFGLLTCLACLLALLRAPTCRGHVALLRASHVNSTLSGTSAAFSNPKVLQGMLVSRIQPAAWTEGESPRHILFQRNVENGVRTLAIRMALDTVAASMVLNVVLIAVLVLTACLCGCMGMAYGFKRALGKAIEEGIELWDRELIGVDVCMQDLEIDLFGGSIEIEAMAIDNPPGWSEKHFLFAGTVFIECRMWKLFSSRMSAIELDRVCFRNINVNFEKTLRGSNIHDLKAYISGEKEKPPSEREESYYKVREKMPEIILHKVEVEDVGVTIVTPGIGRIDVPDFAYDDFDADPGGRTLRGIIEHLSMCICDKGLHHALHNLQHGFGFG